MLVRRLAGLLPEPDETLASERLALARLGADPRAFVHVLNPRTRPEHVLDQHPAQPGPACLTHGGVLVLDRLYRYPAQLLDAVNDAARGSRVGSWPAEFVLLATGRPSKTPKPHRLSRPRGIGGCIDVLAEFEPPDPRTRAGESSERVRARITLARARQDQRFRGRWLDLGWTRNARIPLHSICLDEFCPTSDSGRALIDQLANHRRWTNDQRGALLRVARTVADLDPDRDPGAPLDRECLATAAMFYQP
jgi:magnesium chelatase family protein